MSQQDYDYLWPSLGNSYTLLIDNVEINSTLGTFQPMMWNVSMYRKGTVEVPIPKFYDLIIELKSEEVEETLQRLDFPLEVLKERGVQKEDAERLYHDLLDFVETKAKEKHLKLKDDVKKSVVNLMVLVAKELNEGT